MENINKPGTFPAHKLSFVKRDALTIET